MSLCTGSWGCIQVALNLPQSRSISHLFGSWLRWFHKDLKPLILLGAAATCWLLWLCRNDLVFEKKHVYSLLQVVYSVIHWLRTYVILQKPYTQALVQKALEQLMQTVTVFFFRTYGCWSSFRIDVTSVIFLSLRLCV
jgi:hypothetical protein